MVVKTKRIKDLKHSILHRYAFIIKKMLSDLINVFDKGVGIVNYLKSRPFSQDHPHPDTPLFLK